MNALLDDGGADVPADDGDGGRDGHGPAPGDGRGPVAVAAGGLVVIDAAHAQQAVHEHLQAVPADKVLGDGIRIATRVFFQTGTRQGIGAFRDHAQAGNQAWRTGRSAA